MSGIIFPTKHFRTDKNAVVAGVVDSEGGWVSGSPASLAASGIVVCVFDLGENYRQYPFLVLYMMPVGLSTGLICEAVGSDDTTYATADFRLPIVGALATGTAYFTTLTANGQVSAILKTSHRYCLVRVTNTDAVNAVGATSSIGISLHSR
jgi:hypothetical protein